MKADSALDRMARLAAGALRAPFAGVSLILEGRAATYPVTAAETNGSPFARSICRHVLEAGNALAVTDVSSDPRFAGHAPASALGLRGYLGVPVKLDDGRIAGTICVADTIPREWSRHDMELLTHLSAICATEVSLRESISSGAEAAAPMNAADLERARETEAVLDIALDAVITADHEGKIRGFNRAAETMFGIERDAVIGKPMVDVIVPPSSRAEHRAGFARAVSTGEVSVLGQRVEVVAQRADGSEFPVELAIARLRIEGPPMFTAFIRDISDRLRADAAMREGERRFRQLTDNIREVFWLTSPGGDRILYVSPAFEDIWGRSSSELVGGRSQFLDSVHPDDKARVKAALVQMASSASYDIEYRILRPNGAVRWIHDRAFPVRGEDGSVVRMAGLAEDITMRRTAEAALRESEALFRALTEGSNEIVTILDATGVTKYLSPSFERMLGYSTKERVGRSALEHIHPDDIGLIEQAMDRIRTKPGNTEHVIHRHLHGDGRYRVLESTATNLIDVPQVEGIVINTRDVTERTEAEQALRSSMGRLERITANVPGVVFQLLLAPDGKISFPFVSDAANKIFGVDPERARAEPRLVLDLIEPGDAAVLARAVLQSARVLSPWQWQGRIRLEGSQRWVEGMGRPTPQEDGSVLYDAILFDVTERRQTEEAIRYQAQLLDTVEQAVIAVDRDLRVTWWNSYAERLFGYVASEAIGQPIAGLTVPTEGGRLDLWRDALADGNSRTGEVLRKRKDGSTFVASFSVTPTTSPEGLITGLVGVAVDATERRSLEEQLRQAQKMEAVGRLAGGVAHDFNNLLTVVKLHSELLLESAVAGSALHEDLTEIKKATARGAALTRQLLAFSRQQVLEPKELILETVVRDLDRMLSRLIGDDVELVTHASGSSGCVLADPGQIEQVIVNLALNARDAMPRGGVLLISTGAETLTETEPRLREPDGIPIPHGSYATIEVRDTGVGMDGATRARIFEPFFTTKPVGEGSGLGLATAYGIIEQSGGYVSLETAPGMGSSFRIYLPMVDRPAQVPARTEPQALPARRGAETILLVEDEQAVRTLAKRILTQRGYRVMEAANGREALEIAKDHLAEIDALVTDAVMPEMGGPELARHLNDMRPGMKTLFMSGYTDDDILRRGELSPGAAFLQKPFSTDQLAVAVREVLDASGT